MVQNLKKAGETSQTKTKPLKVSIYSNPRPGGIAGLEGMLNKVGEKLIRISGKCCSKRRY